MSIRILVIIFLLSLPSFLEAQWQPVAPNLLGTIKFETGTITHKSGILWAANKLVWMSPDSGTTWVQRFNINLANDDIVELSFYSDSIGLACTHQGSVFRTTDQGNTWKEIRRTSSAYSAAFIGSPDNIMIATRSGGTIDYTNDGGMTWNATALGKVVPIVKALIGGGAYAFAGTSAGGLNVFKTLDYGATWQQLPGAVDFDTYAGDVNPCAPDRIYAVNEEQTSVSDGFGEIFTSADGGQSWTKGTQQSRTYYSGSISLSSQAVFVQTISKGVLRSTDQGTSWQPIGGPGAPSDTKVLFAINSNIIIAADNTGTIYRTMNSGGDSLLNVPKYTDLSINPAKLFTTDSLANCDPAKIRPLFFSSQLCSQPEIDTQYIIGPDSLDYKIVKEIKDSLSGFDSVLISFRPRSSGPQTGSYVLVLKDGTKFIIPLAGFGKSIVFVEPTSVDVTVDTIGGTAYVPLQINGLPNTESVELTVHYDSKLQYTGSYSLLGTALDKPNEQWSGRSRISIPTSEIQLDTISGFATFTVFPDGDTCFKVTIDSMNVLNPSAPCLYAIGNGVEINICPPKGCGIMILTNYMRYQTFPTLFLSPNPGYHEFNIAATKDFGESTITIVDELGRLITTKKQTIKQGKNSLSIENIRAGKYYLKIVSPMGIRVLPMIIVE
ncbi:MAG TPA: T9SS type A sorting domain-containing protein [Candidatus Kapabacteria bacterium]|nr:T9SS type A sorting domain-containing protein [Candidatus Kapabacteria bacterium]